MMNSEAPTHLHSAEQPEFGDSFRSAWTDAPPPNGADDPLVGTTLSRTYRITGILGEGGMGRVYEAWHCRITKKRYAIKVLHPEFAREPEILRRFQREAEAAASVSHPNAVGVYDVALTPQGWPYLVCEFLEGLDLAGHIKVTGPLSQVTTKHIALQICSALCEAHACGVIHRDLKPQNVFLVGAFSAGVPLRPDAKVLDFGLSRFLDSSDTELTKTGVIMGTPSYMAPEQAKGLRADHRVDVYGVGVILYSALTGRPPFRADTPQSTLLAVIAQEAPRPTSLNPRISASFELVIQRAMAKEADQRYPDMAALKLAIESVHLPEETPNAAGIVTRAALASEAGSNANIRTSRSRLVLFLAIASFAGFAALATAVASGVVLYTGRWPFTRSESLLLLLVVFGTLLTPAILAVLHLRRSIWGNTARVVELLARVRLAAEAGILSYGAAALALLCFDSVVLRLVGDPTAFTPMAARLPVIGVVLTVVALVATGTAIIQDYLLALSTRGPRSTLLRTRWLSMLVGIAGAAGVLVALGFGVYARGKSPVEPKASTESAGAAATPTASNASRSIALPAAALPEVVAVASSVAVSASPPGLVLALASDEELSAGISQGIAALELLLERYPADPRVLRATGVAYASRAASMGDALEVFDRLFRAAPQTVNEPDLQNMVSRIATVGGAVGTRAFKVMATTMGSAGSDLLYRIALSRPAQRDVALKKLADPVVRSRFSPELAIAYDLHFAATCSARVPLLSRAEQFGDERSIMVLQPLAASTQKGCGPRKRQPCKPTCANEAAAFKKSIEVIAARLRRTSR